MTVYSNNEGVQVASGLVFHQSPLSAAYLPLNPFVVGINNWGARTMTDLRYCVVRIESGHSTWFYDFEEHKWVKQSSGCCLTSDEVGARKVWSSNKLPYKPVVHLLFGSLKTMSKIIGNG